MKVKIIKSVYGNNNNKILDVSLTENGNYLYGCGINQLLILKEDAEVVEDVEKSCDNCKYDDLLGDEHPCNNCSPSRDMRKPIEQVEDVCNSILTQSEMDSLLSALNTDVDCTKTGTTEDATHYMQVGKQQPIEIMQSTMNPEQFVGFLMGNIIKYALRMNHKNKFREDAGKCKQYAEWLVSAIDGEIIVAGKK